MTSLPAISSPERFVGTIPLMSAPHASAHEVYLDPLTKSLPSLAVSLEKDNLHSSESTLHGLYEDDECSVSSSGSDSSYGSEKTFDFMSSKPKSKRLSNHKVVTPISSPDCGGRQISPMKMFAGASAYAHFSPPPPNFMYDNNGRRKSIGELSNSSCCVNNDLHRQIEADLLQHRNLVALKVDTSKMANIARVQIEVDSKVASTMAARTFVDTAKIEVHQRRSSINALSSERRGSGSLPKQASSLCLPPVASCRPRRSSAGLLNHHDANVDPVQRSQLRRAGRVVAASRRLLMGGMQDQVVGTVECMASARSSFHQPRFAQATVGSLMAIKG